MGLGELGRTEAYLARQLKRWRTQWEKTKTRELETMEEVYQALASNIPEQEGAAIVHGDYRLGNMLVDSDGGIAAVLDWELCTLGDPLADLGYVINNWGQPGEEVRGGCGFVSDNHRRLSDSRGIRRSLRGIDRAKCRENRVLPSLSVLADGGNC